MSFLSKNDTEALERVLREGACIVGVGNRMRGDDAVGPLLIDRIAGSVRCTCLDAGVAPENFVEKVCRTAAANVLVVDAIHMDADPGACRLMEPGAVRPGSLSTHALSLQPFSDYISQRCGARVALLGIQPASTQLDAGLSRPVEESLEALCNLIVELSADA